MTAQILPAGTNSIVCGDDYYAFLGKDNKILKVENKVDSCMSKITAADLPPVPDGFMEQWIAINLAFGSDKVVRHFMELESVKEWFAKRSS